MCKAGTLIGDESLVQSVSQPCAHHLDLESYQVEKMVKKKVLKLKRGVYHLNLVIVPLLHHIEDPEIVIDSLGDCVHIVPDKLDVAFTKINSTSSHVNLFCLENLEFSKCYGRDT